MSAEDQYDAFAHADNVIDSIKMTSEQLNSASSLLPLVYNELRELARKRMRSERVEHTLQATALVHEAFNRLASRGTSWNSLLHFYRAAATAMQQILIDHARAKQALKRGDARREKSQAIDISSVADLTNHDDPELILALSEALSKLKEFDEDAAEVVRLRFFAGLSTDRTAMALRRGETWVKDKWIFARAFLARELG